MHFITLNSNSKYLCGILANISLIHVHIHPRDRTRACVYGRVHGWLRVCMVACVDGCVYCCMRGWLRAWSCALAMSEFFKITCLTQPKSEASYFEKCGHG